MIEQMIAVVQAYINHRKGVEVNITIRDNRDIMLLNETYYDAINWFNNNGGIIG